MKIILLSLLASVQVQAACAPGDFVRSEEAQVTVAIQGRGYSPRCLSVKPGTAVTIQASSGHPLQGAQNPSAPSNPFARGSAGTSPETHRLHEIGSYAYFCIRHGDASGNGMAGEVVVE